MQDVYEIVGRPHVVEDLNMHDHPLEQVHDRVAPLTPSRLPILEALRDHEIRLADLLPLPTLASLGAMHSAEISAEEGRLIMSEVQSYERSSKLAKCKKANNVRVNGRVYVCEGCGFRNPKGSLFDTHHLQPICMRERTTTLKGLAVLCPTCHRVVHYCAEKTCLPMDIANLRNWNEMHRALRVHAEVHERSNA